MNPGFRSTGQMADSVYGVAEQFADVNIMNRVAHGGVAVMVWADVCYRQRTQLHVYDGILNDQRYKDEILRPIFVSFIHKYHLLLQRDNALPHFARICIQLIEAETFQFFHGQHTHLSMFGML